MKKVIQVYIVEKTYNIETDGYPFSQSMELIHVMEFSGKPIKAVIINHVMKAWERIKE